MSEIDGPVKKHISGKLPTHSSTVSLYKNFKNFPEDTLKHILISEGYINENYKPTKLALEKELIDICEKNIIWNIDKVKELLESQNLKIERQFVNQELPEEKNEPVWANLGTIATYFSSTANQVGQWLDTLGLRDEDGMASKESSERGLAHTVEMNAGGKKTRSITHWNLHLVLKELKDNGHPLDFNYEETLKGKGKNSDVQVSGLEERAITFAKEFALMYKNPETRPQCKSYISKFPSGIVKRAEELLNKPGFITTGEYLKRPL